MVGHGIFQGTVEAKIAVVDKIGGLQTALNQRVLIGVYCRNLHELDIHIAELFFTMKALSSDNRQRQRRSDQSTVLFTADIDAFQTTRKDYNFFRHEALCFIVTTKNRRRVELAIRAMVTMKRAPVLVEACRTMTVTLRVTADCRSLRI